MAIKIPAKKRLGKAPLLRQDCCKAVERYLRASSVHSTGRSAHQHPYAVQIGSADESSCDNEFVFGVPIHINQRHAGKLSIAPLWVMNWRPGNAGVQSPFLLSAVSNRSK
jgi:hypothetical protein